MNSPRTKQWQGWRCLITAAASGIGRATAEALASSGAHLWLVDIDGAGLRQAAQSCRSSGAAEVQTSAIDCTSAEAMHALAGEVFARWPRLDLLQNGVGWVGVEQVEHCPIEVWQKAVACNLWSVVHGTRAFVPRLLQQEPAAEKRRAHIVNIASVAGLVGFPTTAPYAATKAAVVALSESLSGELYGRGIVVSCICPGMVRSNLLAASHIVLPRRYDRILHWAHDHLAPSPESTAREILRAVRKNTPLSASAPGFSLAWWLKRASPVTYQRVARQLTRLLID